ncbi:MAG: PIN domain-containing protein [Thermoprotei archaeon]|nr:PIN domain-containing protein [Thermoprotei archaeon]
MNGSKKFALDTSFLIYHYYKGNKKTSELLRNGVINYVTLSEVLYVLCRYENPKEALSYIEEIVKLASIAPSSKVSLIAGQFKCKYPIALADCWVLATAKVYRIPSLFAFKEKEIIKHLDLIKKEVGVVFLDEIV